MADGQEKQQEQAVARRAPTPITMRGGTMEPQTLPELIEFAKFVAHSSMVPKQFQGNVGDVIVAVQMGRELGLSPMSALQNVAVINGRPSLWGDAVLALVTSREDCEDVIEQLDEKTMTATCTVKRRGRTATVRSFSLEDAKTAGLWGKQGPWTQYPKRMLQMRARAFAVRDAFPDALRSISVAEEAQDATVITQAPTWVDDKGEPVEGVHTFGRKRQVQQDEPPHNPTTGEVTATPAAETTSAPANDQAKPAGKVAW